MVVSNVCLFSFFTVGFYCWFIVACDYRFFCVLTLCSSNLARSLMHRCVYYEYFKTETIPWDLWKSQRPIWSSLASQNHIFRRSVLFCVALITSCCSTDSERPHRCCCLLPNKVENINRTPEITYTLQWAGSLCPLNCPFPEDRGLSWASARR